MKKNLFIVLEGIDGSGKSSQIKLLEAKLSAEGHKVVTTLEPSSGYIGSLLTDILTGKIKTDHRVIAALFTADRLEHITNVNTGILQHLRDGYTVISDRYYFSSYAYNGSYSGMDWVIALNKKCSELLRPDLNIFIDVPPEVCMQRIKANRDTTELFEKLDTLTKVKAQYFEAFELLKNEERIFITDGNRPVELIASDIWNCVSNLL
jgi:dTMP kinase